MGRCTASVHRSTGIGRLMRGAFLTGAVALALVAAPRSPGHAEASQQVRRTAIAGDISTVAGGVGGPAKATTVSLYNRLANAYSMDQPCGVSYAAGRVYVGDGGSVRSVSTLTDWLTTPAGNGLGTQNALLGDGGPAPKAKLNNACGVATDGSGNLVIADADNGLIRVEARSPGTFYGQAMTAGDIYTVAGGGPPGFIGDGGPATAANLYQPEDVIVDGTGNLVIADSGNGRIRVVATKNGTFYGQRMRAGYIYSVAGNGAGGFSGDGGPATKAALGPTGVALDGTGDLVIADFRDNRIRVVAASTGTFYGQAMTAGDIYTIAGDNRLGGFSGDGGPATAAALYQPSGVTVDGHGNVLIADTVNCRIRVVAASTGTFYGRAMTAGDIYTVAGGGAHSVGDGGPATKAQLNQPTSVAVDGTGNLVIADESNDLVRVVAAGAGSFYGRAMRAADIYAVAGNGRVTFSGNRGQATHAELDTPGGLATDHANNLVIADMNNNLIRVVAHQAGTFYGQPMTAGHIYTVAGGGTQGLGDGGPATTGELDHPSDVAVDGHGNVLIADSGNDRIRVVAVSTGTFYGQSMTAGDIYTIAGNDPNCGFGGNGGPAVDAELCTPEAVAIDGAGNVLIADSGNGVIRVIANSNATYYGQAMTAGDIYTVAGGGSRQGSGIPAIGAWLNQPGGLTTDPWGNVVIADTYNSLIQVVARTTGTFYGQAMTAGDIYTVAGGGSYPFTNGVEATAAALEYPVGVAVDGAGDLMIADNVDNEVRMVAAKTGTFYGQAMNSGYIYSIAGDFNARFAGDGGPGTQAELFGPQGVATDSSGNVFAADTANDRIRRIAG